MAKRQRGGRTVIVLLVVLGGTMTDSSDARAQELPDFDALWNYQKPDETEGAFRDILPRAREAGSADYLAQLLTQIARTEGLQKKFDAAHTTLDEVEAMLGKGLEVAGLRYLLERGRAFNSSGKKEAARPLFLKAWERGREVGQDYYAVDAAHMMGIIEPPDEAIEWNEKAMALAESSEDPKAGKWLGSLYNNLGWTYHDKGDFERALGLFEKGLAWREEAGTAGPLRIAHWCVARALRSLGRVEEALAKLEKLEEEWKEAGEDDGYVFEELGECLLALGRDDEARPHFARAFELLSKDIWLSEQEPDRIARLKELSRGKKGGD